MWIRPSDGLNSADAVYNLYALVRQHNNMSPYANNVSVQDVTAIQERQLMAHNWDSSRRPKDPPGWKQTRALALQRAGGLCQASPPCLYPATQVDHIVNLLSGGTHDFNNLQALCEWHHKQKTAQEAAKARGPRVKEKRPPTIHPGLL